jgi:tetratricopeptide (TPR) repeat protein
LATLNTDSVETIHPNTGSASTQDKPASPHFAPAVALVALVLLAYIPAIPAGWIWDDDAHITHTDAMRSLDGLRRIWLQPEGTQYYPIVFSTFWIEYQLWGPFAPPYHLLNILLHGLNACLIWRILLHLQLRGAWFAAALFALHPVHVESVAWATERKNVLSGLFYLSALLAYLRFETTRLRGWYVTASAAFVAALLSKTVTCTLPAVLLLLIWWRRGRISRTDWLHLLPWFAVGLCLGLPTIWLEKHNIGAKGAAWSLTALQRCLIAANALLFYAAKLLWPIPLIFIYPRWHVDPANPTWYIGPVVVITVIAGLWLLRHRLGNGPLVAVLIFAGTLFPALGFFNVYPFRYSFVADHFQYLASVSLIALAATAGAMILGKRWPARVLAGLLLLVLAILTCRRSMDYSSEQTLWEDTLVKYPDCSLAHARLGVILAARGQYRKAVDHFHEVVRLNPDSPDDRLKLANFSELAGQLEEAVAQYRALLVMAPDLTAASGDLARCLCLQGHFDEAVRELEAALRFHPDDANVHCSLGLIRADQGRLDQAIAHMETATRLEPSKRAFSNILAAMRQARKKR